MARPQDFFGKAAFAEEWAALVAPPIEADIGKALVVNPNLDLVYKSLHTGRKNYIINGNFDVWQRDITQTGNGILSVDRWLISSTGSTKVVTKKVITLGQVVITDNPTNNLRIVITSVAGAANVTYMQQRIEGVSSLSGGKATLSFWAAVSAEQNIAFELYQDFGTGGSPSAVVRGSGTAIQLVTGIPAGFKKFSFIVDIPSIVGKTIGTDGNDCLVLRFYFEAGSNYDVYASGLGQRSGTFNISQIQLEEGEVATEFERRTYADELFLCQRYYQIVSSHGVAYRYASTIGSPYQLMTSEFPVLMRADPSAAIISGPTYTNCSTIVISCIADGFTVSCTSLAVGIYRAYSYIMGFNAEL